MNSRDAILDSIRRHRPAPTDLPDLDHEWTTYADPRAKFIEALEAVGGKILVARDQADLNKQLHQLPQYSAAQQIASVAPGIASQNVDPTAIDSPHALSAVDLAIMPGRFGVAENGAVWVTDQNLQYRVLYFLCQHLILVVPAGAIVNHMHDAYQRIEASSPSGSRPFERPEFGAFISGPSKTADIEQTLVIGAHGPRSLTVFLVEE